MLVGVVVGIWIVDSCTTMVRRVVWGGAGVGFIAGGDGFAIVIAPKTSGVGVGVDVATCEPLEVVDELPLSLSPLV